MWPLIVGVVRSLNRVITETIDDENIDTKIYVFGLPAEDRPRLMQVYLTYSPEIEDYIFEELKTKKGI
jgi:hypothetical protein